MWPAVKRRNEMTNRVSSNRNLSWWIGVALLALVGVFFIFMGMACNEGREGDRCNPVSAANGEDECGSGLSCQMPSTCVENYCCPKDPSTSTNGYCNGMLCPAPADAGSP